MAASTFERRVSAEWRLPVASSFPRSLAAIGSGPCAGVSCRVARVADDGSIFTWPMTRPAVYKRSYRLAANTLPLMTGTSERGNGPDHRLHFLLEPATFYTPTRATFAHDTPHARGEVALDYWPSRTAGRAPPEHLFLFILGAF